MIAKSAKSLSDHLHNVMRPNLLRMMSWAVGIQRGFDFRIGKNYKCLDKFLPAADWAALESTYAPQGLAGLAHATSTCHRLFRNYARTVVENLGYVVPPNDAAASLYAEAAAINFARGDSSSGGACQL